MPARRRSASLLTITALAALAGCRGARPAALPSPAPLRLTLSSVGSGYSPEVRAVVRVRADGDSLRLTVDSGAVRAPGQPAAFLPPVMTALEVTAILAVPRPQGVSEMGAPGGAPDGSAWIARAVSPMRYGIDSLRLGVPHALTGAEFALPRPAPGDAAHAFLVLRVAGTVLTIGRGPDGVVRPVGAQRGGVRVYACAIETLNGHVDPARTAALAHAYMAAC